MRGNRFAVVPFCIFAQGKGVGLAILAHGVIFRNILDRLVIGIQLHQPSRGHAQHITGGCITGSDRVQVGWLRPQVCRYHVGVRSTREITFCGALDIGNHIRGTGCLPSVV